MTETFNGSNGIDIEHAIVLFRKDREKELQLCGWKMQLPKVWFSESRPQADSYIARLIATTNTNIYDELQATVRSVVIRERLKRISPTVGGAYESEIDLVSASAKGDEILQLVRLALCGNEETRQIAREAIGELYKPSLCPWNEVILNDGDRDLEGDPKARRQRELQDALYELEPGSRFPVEALRLILAAQATQQNPEAANQLIRRMVAGPYGNLEGLEKASHELFRKTWHARVGLMTVCCGLLIVFNWCFNSPNHTSVHSFYRDRLRTAFVVEPVSSEADNIRSPEVKARERILLSDLAGKSKDACGPYPLICAALNLQGSSIESIRDRNASSFLFSPLFVGSDETRYVDTKLLEAYDTDLTADTAMAISAAAAAPNMGKYTFSWLSFLIVLLNIRLGRWIPHPENVCNYNTAPESNPVDFTTIQKLEDAAIEQRRKNAGIVNRERVPRGNNTGDSNSHFLNLFGLALSGGGIRSASVSLGVTQALHRSGLFAELDYLSSVSGGGYTATAISTFMGATEDTEVQSPTMPAVSGCRRFFNIPPSRYLLREMTCRVRESLPWVYVSDGGHFENLAAYELLKRRARVIIVSDGEADPKNSFGGISALMRLAEIDLNTRIVFADGGLEKLRLRKTKDQDDDDCWRAESNFAVGRIYYKSETTKRPPDGWLIYVRSTILEGDDAVIRNLAKSDNTFPHQTTADQNFDELQFEAYRRLGEVMMQRTLDAICNRNINLCYESLLDSLDQPLVQSF